MLDPLTERIDALDGEGALDATLVIFGNSTERVAVQAAATQIPMVRKCDMAQLPAITHPSKPGPYERELHYWRT